MEVIDIRYDAIKKALTQLDSSLSKIEMDKFADLYDELRDSVIQRFEFCVDTLWKYLREYLQDQMKVKVEFVSLKNVFKACFSAKLISEDELEVLFKMVEDRNLTSHTYNKDLAEEIYKRIPKYYDLMKKILDRCKI